MDGEEAGSAVHKGSIQDMELNDRSGLFPMIVHAYGCMHTHAVVCSQLKQSYYLMAPCGSFQRVFGFPDRERDSRDLSPVLAHPCFSTLSPNNSPMKRCVFDNKKFSDLGRFNRVLFATRLFGACASAGCPTSEYYDVESAGPKDRLSLNIT